MILSKNANSEEFRQISCQYVNKNVIAFEKLIFKKSIQRLELCRYKMVHQVLTIDPHLRLTVKNVRLKVYIHNTIESKEYVM